MSDKTLPTPDPQSSNDAKEPILVGLFAPIVVIVVFVLVAAWLLLISKRVSNSMGIGFVLLPVLLGLAAGIAF